MGAAITGGLRPGRALGAGGPAERGPRRPWRTCEGTVRSTTGGPPSPRPTKRSRIGGAVSVIVRAGCPTGKWSMPGGSGYGQSADREIERE